LQHACVFETVPDTTHFNPEDEGSTFLPKQQDQHTGQHITTQEASLVLGFFQRKRWV
jgi:hypothetical protein